ncbi:uncharacterized protein BKA78DRAFT_302293 [Phyllosticta capitalensis]|uniref:uncharacterized protein n=1 Tax=Phyllosticta capitalensis TaxID=121624 RepID=UPI0031309CC2
MGSPALLMDTPWLVVRVTIGNYLTASCLLDHYCLLTLVALIARSLQTTPSPQNNCSPQSHPFQFSPVASRII